MRVCKSFFEIKEIIFIITIVQNIINLYLYNTGNFFIIIVVPKNELISGVKKKKKKLRLPHLIEAM